MRRLKQQLSVCIDRSLSNLPSRCLWCNQQAVHSQRNLCDQCYQMLPWNNRACPRCALPLSGPPTGHNCLPQNSALERLYAPLRYARPLDQWIPALKDSSNLNYLPLFHKLLCHALDPARQYDLVVPIPLHWRRLLGRGFNQAELLARPVAKHLATPLASRCLKRNSARTNQKELKRAERLKNLHGAFSCRPLEGQRILLIDDVATTGATLQNAAQCLRRAGSGEVQALVLARTPPPEKS